MRDDEICVLRGETVTVLSSNLSRGYLVHRPATPAGPPAEGWLPSYCLHLAGAAARPPSAWAFRLQKQSRPPRAEGFSEHLNNVSVVVGETAVLCCKVEGEGGVVWKGPGGAVLAPSQRLGLAREEGGGALLTLTHCRYLASVQYSTVQYSTVEELLPICR